MTALRLDVPMTVDEFVAWDDGRYELVEGRPRLMAPHSDAHGTIQANVARVLGGLLAAAGSPCRPVVEGGVRPRLRASYNYRKPDVAVTCAPNEPGALMVPDPVLIVEILSAGEAETRENIARYTTLESVREIVLLHSLQRLAEVWRRGPAGWPADAELVGPEAGSVRLETLGLEMPFDEVYRWVAVP